jgi:hypothetical protein
LVTKEALEQYCGIHQSTAIRALVVEHKEPTFTEPADPGKDPTPGQLEKYKMELKINKEEEKKFQEDKNKLFWIILGQCNKPLQAKIKAQPTYPAIESATDVVGLLTTIKELVYSTTKASHPSITMHKQMRRLLQFNQDKEEPTDQYMRRFNEQVEATEAVWGPLIPMHMKGKPKEDQEAARQQFLAITFLSSLTHRKSKDYLQHLNNDFVNGKDHYPKDIHSAMTALTNWEHHQPKQGKPNRPPTPKPTETQFAQQVTQVSEDNTSSQSSGWTSKSTTKKKKAPKQMGLFGNPVSGFQVVEYDHP